MAVIHKQNGRVGVFTKCGRHWLSASCSTWFWKDVNCKQCLKHKKGELNRRLR